MVVVSWLEVFFQNALGTSLTARTARSWSLIDRNSTQHHWELNETSLNLFRECAGAF